MSHSFSPTEQNYQIYDRQLLAIVTALEYWHHFLQGSSLPVIVHTDHKNLTYFRSAQKLNRRQARWSLFLSKFNLKLHHTPGTRMIQSDVLSQCPDHAVDNSENKDVVLLPENLFISIIDSGLHSEIINNTDDTLAMKVLLALKTGLELPFKSDLTDWTTDAGLILFRGRCYVPNNLHLRCKILQRYHNAPPMGHPGQFKTLELVKRDYWWPGLSVFVRNYVEGCATCQQMKVNTHPTAPPLNPISSTCTRPFQQISMDFITDLPNSAGFTCIMVMVDHGLTKGVILLPVTKPSTQSERRTFYSNTSTKDLVFRTKSYPTKAPSLPRQ